MPQLAVQVPDQADHSGVHPPGGGVGVTGAGVIGGCVGGDGS